MNGLYILRRVEGLWPNIEAELVRRQQLIEFEDGKKYVHNDQPWDQVTGHQIVKNTVDFIVIDDEYNRVYGPVRDLAKAESAVSRARARMSLIFEGLDDEPAAASAEAEAVVTSGGARVKTLTPPISGV